MDASSLALKLNAPLVLNLILIGFASNHEDFPLKRDLLQDVITDISPQRFRDLNLKGFREGLEHKLDVEI